MVDPITEIKTRAKQLLRQVQRRQDIEPARLDQLYRVVSGKPPARATRLGHRIAARLEAHDEPELAGWAERVQLRHCLTCVAREFGFRDWTHARHVMDSTSAVDDFGTTLVPRRGSGFLNEWFADYETAATARRRSDGYLLAYARQFLVVTREYVAALGWDPDDTDWSALGRDWVRPRDPAARRRLYGKLLAGSPRIGSR